jgi:hypothetical protein
MKNILLLNEGWNISISRAATCKLNYLAAEN